jgi:xanthine dehydrogenase YagS FAD-binding subunit
MKSFAHHHARSVDEAVTLLARYKGKAKLNAGGTDLLGVLKERILPDYPKAVINIKTIPDLDCIREENGGLALGALTILSHIVESPLVAETYPLIKEAATAVAAPQVRNMATIGGNLCQDTRCWYYRYPDSIGGRIMCLRKGKGPCHAVPGDNRYHAIMGGKKCYAVSPSDLATALCTLDASLTVTGPEGSRSIPIRDFYTTLGNVLAPQEMITHIHIPKPPPSTQRFIKFTLRKPTDFALVSVASLFTSVGGTCTGARITLGAVAPTPIRATKAEDLLKGKRLDEETASEAARLAVADAKPLSMNAYKVEITRTLVKRAILGN